MSLAIIDSGGANIASVRFALQRLGADPVFTAGSEGAFDEGGVSSPAVMAIDGGYVTAEQVGSLTDFTSSSCLDFGPEENLLIEKLATCMPWFVNARCSRYRDAPAARRYQGIAREVLQMTRPVWDAFAPRVREVDNELSAAAEAAGEEHYAIRYNAFMGVRSDWFQAEAAGADWATAAARPVPRALEAAAGESC